MLDQTENDLRLLFSETSRASEGKNRIIPDLCCIFPLTIQTWWRMDLRQATGLAEGLVEMQDSSCGGVLPLPGSSPLLNLFSAMSKMQKHQLISLTWIKIKQPPTGKSQWEAWSPYQMWISGTTWGTWEGCHLGHSSLISPEQCLSGH